MSKKAAEHLENKNYQEALNLYEQVLKKDDKDSDALVGQRKAREGVIDETLIRVRMTRLANNYIESFELLREVVVKERDWNLFPTGAVAFTQNEETEEAFRNLNKELMALAPQNKPFRTMYLIERYKMIFTENKIRAFDQYQKGAIANGQKYCLAKIKTTNPTLPFYSNLIQKLCDLSRQKAHVISGPMPLYKKINISVRGVVPPDFTEEFRQAAQTAFQASGWYNPQSKNQLNLSMEGYYNLSENSYYEPRVHTYTQEVPFTQYVQRSYIDPASGQQRTVSEPQTQYRKENRYFNYNVLRVIQKVSARMNGGASDSLINPLSLSYNDSSDYTEQNQSFSNVGLYPSSIGRRYQQQEWSKAVVDNFAPTLLQSLTNDFNRAYCATLTESDNKPQLINQSLYCLRQTIKAPPAIIDRTFESEFNITPRQMLTLVQVVD